MTLLPNLPTDNLYKFLFIGGITLILASFILFATQYRSICEIIEKEKISIMKLDLEIDFLNKDVKESSEKIEYYKNQLNKNKKDTTQSSQLFTDFIKEVRKNKDFRDYLTFMYSYKKDVIPFYEETIALDSASEQYKSRMRQVIVNTKLLSLGTENIKQRYTELVFLCGLIILLVAFGLFLTISGLIGWHKIQNLSDEKLKLELLNLKSNLTESEK